MPNGELFMKLAVHGRWLLSAWGWGPVYEAGPFSLKSEDEEETKVGVWGSGKSMGLGTPCVCSGTNTLCLLFLGHK